MTDSQLRKSFYQAMKAAAKKRKIKLSAQQDLYKKVDPYFFHAFYHASPGAVHDGKVAMIFDISIKYHRFDELHYHIIRPGDPIHFTDKIRANSGALCPANFPRMTQSFDYDGTEEALPELCEVILDFLQKYCTDFLNMVEREYGDLREYYIAHRSTMPLLAGLAYLDKGDFSGAAQCFSQFDLGYGNSLWSVEIHTEEQRRRAQTNGIQIFHHPHGDCIHRSRQDQFRDYAVALQKRLEWTNDRAMYGLLPEEREKTDK